MRMANIGIGVGALADGFSRGIDLGRTLKDVRNENQIETIRKEGLANAREQRDQAISSRIQPIAVDGLQPDQQGPTRPQRDGLRRGQQGPARPGRTRREPGYRVGSETYGDEESARQAASRSAPSTIDLFMENTVPQLREAYLEQGNVQMANAWDQWSSQRRNQNAMREWSEGYLAFQSGDLDKAAGQFGDFYNKYVDDGIEYVGHEAMEDEDGNITGFKMTIKNTETGKTSEVPMDRESMVNMAMSHNPQALFEMELQRTQSANEARLEDAQAEREAQRDYRYDTMGAERDHGHELEQITTRERARAANQTNEAQRKFDQNAEILREAGFTEDQIRELTPRILGIANTRAESSDSDLRARVYSDLSSGGMIGFNRLPPEEQRAKIDAVVEMIKGQSGASRPEAGGLP